MPTLENCRAVVASVQHVPVYRACDRRRQRRVEVAIELVPIVRLHRRRPRVNGQRAVSRRDIVVRVRPKGHCDRVLPELQGCSRQRVVQHVPVYRACDRRRQRRVEVAIGIEILIVRLTVAGRGLTVSVPSVGRDIVVRVRPKGHRDWVVAHVRELQGWSRQRVVQHVPVYRAL